MLRVVGQKSLWAIFDERIPENFLEPLKKFNVLIQGIIVEENNEEIGPHFRHRNKSEKVTLPSVDIFLIFSLIVKIIISLFYLPFPPSIPIHILHVLFQIHVSFSLNVVTCICEQIYVFLNTWTQHAHSV